MPRKPLEPHGRVTRGRRPVVLCICDGMGYGRAAEADAVRAAYTPVLDMLHARYPHTALYAHGTHVGLPEDTDMGNSEVGHNCIGCGRVLAQGAKLINEALASGALFGPGTVWARCVAQAREGAGRQRSLHLVGLFSDGNVHSHLAHLFALLRRAKADGVGRVRLHLLFDGRDVGETSGPLFIEKLDGLLAELNTAEKDGGFECRVASGGGRMTTTMDRYEADWGIVERGFLAHVHGVSVHGNYFGALGEAYAALQTKGRRSGEGVVIDQNLEEFVLVDGASGRPVGPVEDGDVVVLFNFRGDRALEFSQAMDAVAGGEEAAAAFRPFRLAFGRDEVAKRYPAVAGEKMAGAARPVPRGVFYAGMMLYDGDLQIPRHFLVDPPRISDTLDDYLTEAGVACYAVSETQKYGHVTYFFNGNRSGKFSEALDTYEEVASDKDIEFSRAPWMKAHEITRLTEAAIRGGRHPFIRLNYPNPDMVGHCGDFEMARLAVECVDVCLGRLHRAVSDVGGCLIVIADHGNSDEMFELTKDGQVKKDAQGRPVVKTSHSLNPVPCIIVDEGGEGGKKEYRPELRSGMGLSSVAATVLELLGFKKPDEYDESVLQFE
ncbi:2,3-bisphosphoglycerate-independent phosphoglycerate mutase [Giardia muris]|uniref:phosphoglycerate mutase (2,3-diphosphoglycerate-independent) n=1 Tax=Giardia muris TaxID=5742 RepID=A0A4Z1SSJ0_GIAMU|nr:2,3-bisphosphoglycerate-independent phosphoglycerate mutase [Giardia muris]|eukprot:TNJ26628.1 2,3-bisphosphoglycerate-independent phosphoglycerate mutase [Giardia muris]